MNDIDIFILIVAIIGWATAIIITRQCYSWRKRYEVLKTSHYTELEMKDAKLAELKNEIKTYESWESIVHVEKFVVDPLVFNVKLDIDRDVFDNVDSFKSFCLNQTAGYISKVLKKNDNLYQLIYEQNSRLKRDNIIIRFRLTPFKEDADWSKVPISTKINDICQYKPLEDCNPATDFSVL